MSLIDWIAVAVNFPDHSKVVELAAELNEPLVDAYVIRIWAWAGRLAQDGVVRGHSADIPRTSHGQSMDCPGNGEDKFGRCAESAGRILESAARWRGEPGRLAAAMLRVRLLDLVSDGLKIHDWEHHAGKFIKKAADERDRKRRERGADIPRTFRGQVADTARTFRAEKEIEKEKEREEKDMSASADRSIPLEPQQLALTPSEPVDDARSVQAQRVFEHWRKAMGKNGSAVFGSDRKRAVEARLKEGHSVEQLCKAIDGCANTPWNMGQNERHQRYDDLELICRSSSNVDRFAASASGSLPSTVSRPLTAAELDPEVLYADAFSPPEKLALAKKLEARLRSHE